MALGKLMLEHAEVGILRAKFHGLLSVEDLGDSLFRFLCCQANGFFRCFEIEDIN